MYVVHVIRPRLFASAGSQRNDVISVSLAVSANASSASGSNVHHLPHAALESTVKITGRVFELISFANELLRLLRDYNARTDVLP